MMINQIIANPTFLHLSIILLTFIITFCRVLGKDFFWVIDDLDGIARFSDRWDEGKKEKIDTYDCCTGDKTHKVNNLAFNPHLGFPGSVLRFIRLNLGKKFKVIGTNEKGHEIWGYTQSPARHHLQSMVIQAINLVLGYLFLKHLVPEPVAFGACLLYSVHPLTTQCVGWISGINYSLSMMFSLALLNSAISIHHHDMKYFLIPLFSFLSSLTLYTGCFTFIILFFLGLKIEALVAGVIGLSIFYWKGKETKDYRSNEFKKQNMHQSTLFNYRKPIVMFKTLWYYLRVVFLPINMGLYHIWGYFYDEPIERINWMFIRGVLTAIAVAVSYYFGSFAIRIGILWFFTYFILFSNFITAQQFVSDRYVMIPSFGICLILAKFLYGTPLFWVLLGLYAMRSFMHLPTFKNEIDFYYSNWWNFRKSEVSLGNLGVAYVNQGMSGAAVDMWFLATKINPLYDVPWYNLYSVFKGSGKFHEAKDFLTKCLNAKVVHFEDRWKDEMVRLDELIGKTSSPHDELFQKAKKAFEERNPELELQMIDQYLATPSPNIPQDVLTGMKNRQLELRNALQHSNPMPEQAGPVTPGSDPVDQKPGLPAGSN